MVTDALQAVFVIGGAALILWIGLGEVGGWQALTQRLEEDHLRLVKPVDDAFLPWPGLLGVILLGLPQIHFTYMSLVMLGAALGVMALVSLMQPAQRARPASMFHLSDLEPETGAPRGRPWYRDYRFQAAALGLIMLAFIALVW